MAQAFDPAATAPVLFNAKLPVPPENCDCHRGISAAVIVGHCCPSPPPVGPHTTASAKFVLLFLATVAPVPEELTLTTSVKKELTTLEAFISELD